MMQLRKPVDERLLDEVMMLEDATFGGLEVDAKLLEAIEKTRSDISKAFDGKPSVRVQLSN